jgi:hypothetical protein
MPLAVRFNGHLLNNELHEFQGCIRIIERNLSKFENCGIMNHTKLGLMLEKKMHSMNNTMIVKHQCMFIHIHTIYPF